MGLTFQDKGIRIFLKDFTLPEKKEQSPSSKKKKIIIIAGPTCVGKSQLSLIVSKAIGGEIVSADSMQVYRGMDIGTAKVNVQERQQVHHHMIDSRDLDEEFNVVEFFHEAWHAIQEIQDKGAVPVVVGGSGFYIHSLIYGPPSGPPSDSKLRKMFEEEMESKGPEILYEKLKSIDPDYAQKITKRDKHKIIRALEIMSLTRQKVSDLLPVSSHVSQDYDFRCWFLSMSKEVLYPRIEMRCDQMIADGFIQEVAKLKELGLSSNSTASQAIGYSQCLEYLSSAQTQKDWDEFMRTFKQASRRYAKRQFTWFRKEPLFRWLDVETMSSENAAEIIIQDFEVSF